MLKLFLIKAFAQGGGNGQPRLGGGGNPPLIGGAVRGNQRLLTAPAPNFSSAGRGNRPVAVPRRRRRRQKVNPNQLTLF